MPLPSILEPPAAPSGMQEWFFAHARDHEEIINAIQAQTGIKLTVYNLDQADKDMALWMERHSQTHNDMNGVVGVAGSDLDIVDWKDPNQVEAWLYGNYQEHLGVRTALKI